VDIGALAVTLRRFTSGPLIAVGSGGSFTSAHFASFLHSLYAGKLARPMTPYELASSPVSLRDLSVLFLTAGGSNPDILGCLAAVVQQIPERLGLLCTCLGSPLAGRAASVASVGLHEFDLPTEKDGFLATNSLLATAVLLARAYQHDLPSPESLPSSFKELTHPGQSDEAFHADLSQQCRPLWDRATIVVLHGQVTQAAAIDLESKFTEAALGQVQLADYRNFAHGRHHWLAKHGESTAILSLGSSKDIGLAEETLALLPKKIPVARFEVGSGAVGGLKALILSLYIAGLAGLARGIDPGRPSVPPFGRKLYHLNGAYRSRADSRLPTAEAVAITRKAGTSITTLAARGTLEPWRESYASFVSRLRSAIFGAMVFDYDGTLCDATERYRGPRTEVTERLTDLLRGGILIGIATGRGKSVRKDLRERIRDPRLMSRLLIGYHNGAEIAFLNDDANPPSTGELDEPLKAIIAGLEAEPRLPKLVRMEALNRQITLELLEPSADREVWELVQRTISRLGPPDVTALTSSHSVDILAAGVTKSNVIRRIEEELGVTESSCNVLCIGDQGRWPGNDFALLQEPCSLSVDEVSSDPSTCWNLASAESKYIGAFLEYLRRTKLSDGAVRIRI